MKMTAMFLATLVAVLLAGGCNALTGCPGSPECDPNWVPPTDGGADGNGADGSVSKGDVSSSPETEPVTCDPDFLAMAQEVAGKKVALASDPANISLAKLTPNDQYPKCGILLVDEGKKFGAWGDKLVGKFPNFILYNSQYENGYENGWDIVVQQ